MAGRHILIDGYNVIRADPNLLRLESQSLENARTALIRTVAASPRFAGDVVTVVFDGIGERSYARRERYGNVTMVFPEPGTSADDNIKRQAAAARDPSQTVIVTNDTDIRDFCASLGCTVTGSENLLTQISLPRKLRPVPTEERTDSEPPPTSGTQKKGNPRRLSKRERHRRDYRF